MASATPDLWLPSQSQNIAARDWCQIILLSGGEGRHVCGQLAGGHYLTATRPGVELAISRSLVSPANALPLHHEATATLL